MMVNRDACTARIAADSYQTAATTNISVALLFSE
jgi:hypothetical protein